MTSSLMEDYDSYGHPRIPLRGYYDKSSCNERRAWAENFGSCSLKHCSQWWHNEGKDDSCSCSKLKGNIENPIGLAKVPLAVCGPLLFKSEHVSGYCLCPFATTEGALVASITRGAVAITRSGGVYAKVLDQTQVRSPYFRLRSMGEVHLFFQWIDNHCDQIKDRVKSSSQHASLKKVDVVCVDRVAVVHFKYSTGDACGQNMVTSVTSYLCQWILLQVQKELPQVKVLHYCIESGLSGDKKMSFANLTNTRGFHVQAEAWISEEILKSVLKVDVLTLMTCYNEWHHLLSGSGIVGLNSNVSNLIAGVSIATGQDPASVDSSHAIFSLSRVSSTEIPLGRGDLKDEGTAGIYASISLPSLNVGTVGGGTSLATQKECLQLMDCYGKDGALRLCEVIAGYALSLELSTFSALASGQFASAHEKLGRNHPTLGLKDNHLNHKFFAEALSAHGKVISVAPFQVNTGNSILSEVTKSEMSKKVGHFGFYIEMVDYRGSEETLQVVIKSKATALETCNMLNKIAQSCGLELAVEYQKHKMELGFNYSDVREVQIYSMKNQELHDYFPRLYYTLMEPSKDIFLIMMEYLSDKNYTHLDTINKIEDWTLSDIKIVLRDLARLHSIFFMKTEHLKEAEWIEMRSTRQQNTDMSALWNELLKHANYEFPNMWDNNRVSIMKNAIHNIDIIEKVLAGAPSTLIHNDCNPRNLCLRKHPVQLKEPGEVCTLCLYDWELATIDVPQRDLAEFLTFTLSPATPINVRVELIDFYRDCLEGFSGSVYPIDRFMKVFNLSMLDFGVRRLLMYSMVHTFKDYVYLPRVINNFFAYAETIDCDLLHINSKL